MYFPLIGALPEWKRIAAAYDLVGYAPRGVGRSAPLSCQDPEAFRQGAPPARRRTPRRRTSGSGSRGPRRTRRAAPSGPGDALRHYTSLNNARDLDVLRAALGERKLTFMGASYGTYFGALYATLFPSHVRRMVFDSAVNPDPEQVWYRNNLDQSAAFERRWADFRAWVARHDDVYRLGAHRAAGAAQLRDGAGRGWPREPAGGKVGPGQLQAALLQAGYYDDYWPQRARGARPRI